MWTDTTRGHHAREGLALPSDLTDGEWAVLEPFFPPAVIEPVRLHVATKRYLCATDPDYFSCLSEASVHTLRLQGGPMSPAETADFENNAYRDEAVRVRIWDDEAKVPGKQTPPFEHYAPLLRRVVAAAAVTG